MRKYRELTIYDIAKALNLSPSTVSRALKDHHSIGKKTRNNVKKYAADHGYKPNTIAASLRNNKTNTIGIIMPWINRPFISSLISGVEQAAKEAGYNVIISQSQDCYENELSNANTLYASRVEALVVSLAMDTTNFDHFQRFSDNKIPMVFVDRVTDQLNSDLVIIDNYRSGFMATEHLIQQGCKRIAHIGGNRNLNVYAERERGYRDALTKNQFEIDESMITHGSLSSKEASKQAEKLLNRKHKPDGVFCSNDTSGVCMIQKAKQLGIKIPEELAVIGFNNDAISEIIEPALSTISHPAIDMGVIAAKQVLKRKNETQEIATSETIMLKTEMIVRGSSKRI